MSSILRLTHKAVLQNSAVTLAYVAENLGMNPQTVTIKPDDGYVALVTQARIHAVTADVKVNIHVGGVLSGGTPATLLQRGLADNAFVGGTIEVGGVITGGEVKASVAVRAPNAEDFGSSSSILAVVGTLPEVSFLLEATEVPPTDCDIRMRVMFIQKRVYENELARGANEGGE